MCLTQARAQVEVEVATVARPKPPSPLGAVPVVPNAPAAARSLFAALNRRDVSAVLGLLAEDVVYENLGSAVSLRGRTDVGRFYLEALAGLPEEAVFVLEGAGGDAAAESDGGGMPMLQAGVAWHLELNGVPVPLSRGVGVYRADPRTGRLARVVDSPEHTVKLPAPLLTGAAWASPLLTRGLGPLVLPAARGVSSLLESLAPGAGRIADPPGASGAPGGRAGSLADSFATVLSGMLPFQAPLGGAAHGSAARAGAVGGGSGGGGGGGRMVYRDRTWAAGRGGAASASASAPAMAAGAAANVRASPAPLAAATAPSAAVAAIPGRSVTVIAGASSAGASTSAMGSGPSTTVNNTRGDTIRMRPLPEPDPRPPVPAVGAGATSFASVGSGSFDDDSGEPTTTAGSSGTGADSGGRGGGGLASAASGSSLASADGGASGSGGSGAWSLPFTPSQVFDVDLTSLWEKDAEASQVQEYEAMLDVLQLGGLQKVTARLIDGLDLRHDGERFEVSFVTVVPFFRVSEKSLFGQPTTMTRRDLRDPLTGRQTSVATRVPGGVVVDMSWGAPLAGSLREEYVVSEDGGSLAVTSSLRIGERAASATQVYRRSARNKSDFLASQRNAYGSLEDVLQSQEKKYGKTQY
ncbi:hypothetical protein GPECTOR_26g524 [Gonium pectorale]|uniref:SnoaL-like domain-containing protein n=1 Tax=Gonium pectorale TaxID=33097 RepID=A0A150GFJ2_GONPE|nr:hypothetical protein GPECTOR_26g524 [Gonium pectorale]|eukprot:KXZ48621.1 hypothetical protein GPECTOR_26g524 [Gonium pectorale]